MLQKRNSNATVMLQQCYNNATAVLRWCYNNIILQRYHGITVRKTNLPQHLIYTFTSQWSLIFTTASTNPITRRSPGASAPDGRTLRRAFTLVHDASLG